MDDYIRLSEAPRLVIPMPTCSACGVDTEWDDGLICPQCGTSWDHCAEDGDKGLLYEDWSGETLPGPVIHEESAWRIPLDRGPARDATIAQYDLDEETTP